MRIRIQTQKWFIVVFKNAANSIGFVCSLTLFDLVFTSQSYYTARTVKVESEHCANLSAGVVFVDVCFVTSPLPLLMRLHRNIEERNDRKGRGYLSIHPQRLHKNRGTTIRRLSFVFWHICHEFFQNLFLSCLDLSKICVCLLW